MSSFYELCDKYPPILVRLLARHEGRAMTNAEIARAAEWTELQVMNIASQTSWEFVHLADVRTFTRACGLDFTNREDTNRIECYLRKNGGHPPFKYLTKDPHFATYFRPLIVGWSRSLKQIPTALPEPIRRLLVKLK